MLPPTATPQLRPGNGVSSDTTGTHPSACGRPTVAACASTAKNGMRSEFWAAAGTDARGAGRDHRFHLLQIAHATGSLDAHSIADDTAHQRDVCRGCPPGSEAG